MVTGHTPVYDNETKVNLQLAKIWGGIGKTRQWGVLSKVCIIPRLFNATAATLCSSSLHGLDTVPARRDSTQIRNYT